jgi:hypothetical protein
MTPVQKRMKDNDRPAEKITTRLSRRPRGDSRPIQKRRYR